MAAELNLAMQYTYLKGGVSIPKSYNMTIDVAGTTSICNVISVTTTDVNLTLGGVNPIGGFALFHNMDAANIIQVSDDGTVYAITLKPNEWSGPFRWNTAAIHAKALVATCLLEYILLPA
jgi:hypothetical protein